jgi:putative endonuclease
MFYVYVLKSIKDKKLYIGKTNDLKRRIKEHNNAKVSATKERLPMELVYYEAYKNKTKCGKQELFYKSGTGRDVLKYKI